MESYGFYGDVQAAASYGMSEIWFAAQSVRKKLSVLGKLYLDKHII